MGSRERAGATRAAAGSTARQNRVDAATVGVPGFAGYRTARWARRNPGQAASLAAGMATAGTAGALAGAAAAGGGRADGSSASSGQAANGSGPRSDGTDPEDTQQAGPGPPGKAGGRGRAPRRGRARQQPVMARLARPGGPGVPAGTVRREGPGRPVLAPADPPPEVVPDHGPDVGSAQGGFHRHRACPGRSWRLPAVAPPIAGGVRTHGSPGDVRASTGAVLTGGAGQPGAVGTGGEH